MMLLPSVVTTPTPSFNLDLTSLIQYGVLGVVLILVLFGYLWAKPSVDRVLEDKAKVEKQRDDLLDLYQNEVIPVLREVKDHVVPGLNKVLESQASMERAQGDLLRNHDDMVRRFDDVIREVNRRPS